MRVWQSCLAVLFTFSLLVADSPSDLPGYRAAYFLRSVDAQYLSIFPAKTRYGKFSYGDGQATISGRLYRSSSAALDLMAGIRNVHMKIRNDFPRNNSLYGVVGLNGRYSGVERWVWLGSLVLQPRLASEAFRDMRYIGLLHGRYLYNERTGLHVGCYAEVGTRAKNIQPLIGMDYTCGAWTYQVVYPLKAGVTYSGIEEHAFSLMARPFYTAVRFHKKHHDRSGVAEYTGKGVELRWDWMPSSQWNVWVSVGQSLMNTLKIGNHHNHHRHHVHVHSAPYVQLGLLFQI